MEDSRNENGSGDGLQNLAPSNVQDFKKMLHQMWFELYTRDTRNDTCGFEHVFCGETSTSKHEVTGFHNWFAPLLFSSHSPACAMPEASAALSVHCRPQKSEERFTKHCAIHLELLKAGQVLKALTRGVGVMSRIQFYLEEKKGNVNYYGHINPKPRCGCL